MTPLPPILVAPNGARKTHADHPAVPVTIPEIVATAKACFAAGAGGLHAHVRDAAGGHVLDVGLYRELIAELGRQVPEMVVQITTEAVGRYTPAEQREVVRDVMPKAASVAPKEMLPDDADTAEAAAFYAFCAEAGIALQHILYSPEEVGRLARLIAAGVIPRGKTEVLFVLGRYSANLESDPADLAPFLDELTDLRKIVPTEFMVCAFGHSETAALEAALRAGGKARVGFENSLFMSDGRLARDNAERVAEIAAIARSLGA